MYTRKTDPFPRKLTVKTNYPKVQTNPSGQTSTLQKQPPTNPDPRLQLNIQTASQKSAPQPVLNSVPKNLSYVPRVKSAGCSYHPQAQPNCAYCVNSTTPQSNGDLTPKPNLDIKPTSPPISPTSKPHIQLNPQPSNPTHNTPNPNPTPSLTPHHNPEPAKPHIQLNPNTAKQKITLKPQPHPPTLKPKPNPCPPPHVAGTPCPAPPSPDCSCQPSCFIANDKPGKYVYELPECVDFVMLSGVGAGGGGAGGTVTDYNISGGGGGGGASMVNCPIFNVPPKTQICIVIGQGGAGGDIGDNGKPGEMTSVTLIDPKTGQPFAEHQIKPGHGGMTPGKQPNIPTGKEQSVPPVDNTGGVGGKADSPTLSGTSGQNGQVMPQSFQAVPGGSGAPSLVAPGGSGGVAVASNTLGLSVIQTPNSADLFNGKNGIMGSGGGGGASAIGCGCGGQGGSGYIVLQLGHQLKPISIQ